MATKEGLLRYHKELAGSLAKEMSRRPLERNKAKISRILSEIKQTGRALSTFRERGNHFPDSEQPGQFES
jgi:hypothetical protein